MNIYVSSNIDGEEWRGVRYNKMFSTNHHHVEIKNVVYSGSIGTKIDPEELSKQSELIAYNKGFPSGCHIRFDRNTITLYTSGKFIMPGMKDYGEAVRRYEILKDILNPLLESPDYKELSIANIVAQSHLGYEVLMPRLWIELTSRDYEVMYEPESFPGMIVRVDDATVNLFSSGSFMLLGCTSIEHAEKVEKDFKAVCSAILG